MLRYLPCEHPTHPDCQFYRRHHDTIPELATMQPGPRVYTFFLYLSDVEEGGGTQFDGGFTIQVTDVADVLGVADVTDVTDATDVSVKVLDGDFTFQM